MSKKQSEIPGVGADDINSTQPEEIGQSAMTPYSEPQRGLEVQQVGINDIGALDNAERVPIDLSATYWTPQTVGETKRVIFHKIDTAEVLSQDGSGETIELESAFFITKGPDGTVQMISNASKRLVGQLQSLRIQPGAALEIKYLGPKQNRNNQYKSDSWSIFPLQINIGK